MNKQLLIMMTLLLPAAGWAVDDYNPYIGGNAAAQARGDRELGGKVPAEEAVNSADQLADAVAAQTRGDYATELKILRPLATRGNATAQFILGTMYFSGRGVEQDAAEAARWFRLAADQGLSLAQSNLGVMYYGGQGVTQDYAAAVKWYRLAAAQGDAKAQFNVGWLYEHGRGAAQDYAAAVKWYRLAAAQGNAKAQFNLGVAYQNGRGVTQNFVRAHLWYNLAGAAGEAGAAGNRDQVATQMTAGQIAEAQRLASDCQERKLQGCEP